MTALQVGRRVARWPAVQVLSLLLTAAPAVSCRSSDPAALKADALRRGEASYESRQYVDAVQAYQRAVGLDPRDGEVRLRLAHAHLGAEQWADAAREAIIAADLLPENQEVQLFALSMVLLQSRFSDVLDRTAAILSQQPDNVPALLLRGNAFARLINSTWAMSRIDEALRQGGSVARAVVLLRPSVATNDDESAQDMFRRALQLAPEASEVQLALVNHLWAMGKLDEAEGLLRRCADQNPLHAFANRALGAYYVYRGRTVDAETYLAAAAATGDRDGRVALAELYAATNRPARALPIFVDLVAAGDPAAADLEVRAAELEVRLGRIGPAVARLNALLLRHPRHVKALEQRGSMLFEAGDLVGATADAEAAVAADPRSATARRLEGRVLTARGEIDRAFDQLLEALHLDPTLPDVPRELAVLAVTLGRPERAVEYARQALLRNPADGVAARALVDALVGVGDYAEADKMLRPLLAQAPNAPDLLLRAGRIHAGRGERTAARAVFERILQGAPDFIDALDALVALDLADGHTAQARQRVARARARASAEPRLLLLAARVEAAGGDRMAAEVSLRALLGTDPANVAGSVLLAEILAEHGRPVEARQVLESVLRHRPTSVEALLTLASLFEVTGQPAAARAVYERMLTAQPPPPMAAYRLAALYVSMNERLDRALDLARIAKQALPVDPGVSDLLGWVYVRQGLHGPALPHLQDAVQRAPANAAYRYHLGMAYAGLAQHGNARRELTRALQLDPRLSESPAVRAALEGLPR